MVTHQESHSNFVYFPDSDSHQKNKLIVLLSLAVCQARGNGYQKYGIYDNELHLYLTDFWALEFIQYTVFHP
jgi:hypothetical protein